MNRNLMGLLVIASIGVVLSTTELPAKARRLAVTHHAEPAPLPAEDGWVTLPSGVERGVFTVDAAPRNGDGRILVLRFDPRRFALRLLTAPSDAPTTAPAWLQDDPTVLAAINASMFEDDWHTATSLLRARGTVNNGQLSADNALLLFDPSDGGTAVRAVDRTQEDVEPLLARYTSAIQGIRMIGGDGQNTWAPQPRAWSEAAIGVDRQGNVVFVFARSAWPMHTFVEHVRGLGLDLVHLQHGDGGPPAQLSWREAEGPVTLVGTYESGVSEGDSETTAWGVPNLLGVVAR